MAKMRLSFVTNRHERVEPLLDGTVAIEGVELVTTFSTPPRRSGGSSSSRSSARRDVAVLVPDRERPGRGHGILPVFPSRRFILDRPVVPRGLGHQGAGGPEGQEIGVGEYQQTASLWAARRLPARFRCRQFGRLVDGAVRGAQPRWRHRLHSARRASSSTGFPTDKSLASMLVNHELDAATVGRAFSRRRTSSTARPTIRAHGWRLEQGQAAVPRPHRRGHAIM